MLRLLMCMWYIVIVRSTQQCKLTKSIWGRYLKGHVISKENVKRIGGCLGQCSMEPRCKIINFRFKDLTCELNDADRYTQPWDYLLEEGHAYSDYSKKVSSMSDVTNFPQAEGGPSTCYVRVLTFHYKKFST